MVFNLTPHSITICDAAGNKIVELPNCGWELRLKTSIEPAGSIEGYPLTKTIFGTPEIGKSKFYSGQEDPWTEQYKHYFIVSQLVKTSYIGSSVYDFLLVPAEVVRDAAGNIQGCKSLGI